MFAIMSTTSTPGRANRANVAMPETRDIALVRWGEELRRHRSARRQARFRMLAAAAAAAAASVFATLLWPPRPALVWNATASSRIGLYTVGSADKLRRGDTVIARAPGWARTMADERNYLPRAV